MSTPNQSPLVAKAMERIAAVRHFLDTLVEVEALPVSAAADCLRALTEAKNALKAFDACVTGADIHSEALKRELSLALENVLDESIDPSEPRRDRIRREFWNRITPFFQPRLF